LTSYDNSGKNLITFHTAQMYLDLGYSVIPLQHNAKTPAISWKTYQTRNPNLIEVKNWYTSNQFGGIGIVTGHVSQLAVLDFDTLDLFMDFEEQFPDLAKTRQVKTKRGYHFYFKIGKKLQTRTRKGQGVDWLWEGCYVVAPPTQIDDHHYKLRNGGLPIELTKDDLKRIHKFLEAHKVIAPETEEKSEKEVFSPVYERVPLKKRELQSLYQSFIEQYQSRNEGLFYTALKARDSGLSLAKTKRLLIPMHIQQAPLTEHHRESEAQRRREGQQTIVSAYSRPPGRPHTVAYQLDNAAREYLLQAGQAAAARILDGLYFLGKVPGDEITRRDMMEAIGVTQINNWSIRKTLAFCTENGESLFICPPRAAAYGCANAPENKCFVGKKKPTRSRPPDQFILPSPLQVCQILGVTPMGSDELNPNDVKSSKAYRQGVHRALIQRRPGKYSRNTLANRVGVTTRTIDTYNKEPGINRQATYVARPVYWHTLHTLPFDFGEKELRGHFFQDANGKRYPFVRSAVVKALKKGKAVWHMQQDFNYYWYGRLHVNLPGEIPAPPKTRLDVKTYFDGLYEKKPWLRKHMKTPENGENTPNHGAEEAAQQQSAEKPKKRKKSYRRKLADEWAENCANWVHETLNRMCQDKAHKISLKTARRLVDQSGEETVRRAVKRIQSRNNVNRPVAMLITMLRGQP